MTATFVHTETFAQTVEGLEYEDVPNVIERGDDIPVKQENHPPVQTEYIRTELSVVTYVV